MSDTKRVYWVDLFKGILIVLMVLAHTPGVYVSWIYCFHMAAFFFVSGYTTDYNKYDLVTYIKKKTKTLILPFFIVNIIFLLIQYYLNAIGKYSVFYDGTFTLDNIVNFFKYMWTPDFGGATWFLIVLFISSIVGKIIHDLLNCEKFDQKKISLYQLGISFGLVFAAYALFYNEQGSLQFYLDLIPMALLFLSIGNYIKNTEFKFKPIFKCLALVLSVIVYIWYCKYNYSHIEWVTRRFPNIFIMIAISLSGIFIVYSIVRMIDGVKKKIKILNNVSILSYIGNNTLPIMLYHFLGFRVFYVILYYLKIVDASQLKMLVPKYGDNLILCIITVIFAIGFSLIINWLVNKVIGLFKTKNFISYNWFNILLLTVTTFSVLCWTLSSSNYFLLDDWNNLVKLPYINYSDFISILPSDVYCSRPGGWFVVKLLLGLFGKNYFWHAFSMIVIHIVNEILLYFFIKKIFMNNKNANFISLLTCLVFGLYPISSFATFWEAGMFDLFGFTCALVSMLAYIHMIKSQNIIKKIILSLLMIISYYIAIRTKEMFIVLPGAFFAYSFLEYLVSDKVKELIKKRNIINFLKNNISIIVMVAIMIAYYVYTHSLTTANSVTVNINDPYYFVFDPQVIITNLLRYLHVYFKLDSMVYGNVTDIISYSLFYRIAVYVISLAICIYSGYRLIVKKDNKLLFFIILFLFIILPVLPMKNMQHILYLYAPAAFIGLIISYLVSIVINNDIKKSTITIIATILYLFAINLASPIQNFRGWWYSTATTDHNTYEYFHNIYLSGERYEEIHIINVPEVGYTSFWNGNGFIVKVAFDNPNQKVFINSNDYNTKDKKQLIIDFNNYDFITLSSSEKNDKTNKNDRLKRGDN